MKEGRMRQEEMRRNNVCDRERERQREREKLAREMTFFDRIHANANYICPQVPIIQDVILKSFSNRSLRRTNLFGDLEMEPLLIRN